MLVDFSEQERIIDFSDFIGQKITEITSVGLELVNLKFVNGILNVECSWRLRSSTGILVGINERKETEFIAILKAHLMSKPITQINYFESGDLIIEFEGRYFFDLFADSSTFEHFQLYLGETLFLVGR